MLQNMNLTLSCLAKQGGGKCEPVGNVIPLCVLDRWRTSLGLFCGVFHLVEFLFRRKTFSVLIHRQVSGQYLFRQNSCYWWQTALPLYPEICAKWDILGGAVPSFTSPLLTDSFEGVSSGSPSDLCPEFCISLTFWFLKYMSSAQGLPPAKIPTTVPSSCVEGHTWCR